MNPGGVVKTCGAYQGAHAVPAARSSCGLARARVEVTEWVFDGFWGGLKLARLVAVVAPSYWRSPFWCKNSCLDHEGKKCSALDIRTTTISEAIQLLTAQGLSLLSLEAIAPRLEAAERPKPNGRSASPDPMAACRCPAPCRGACARRGSNGRARRRS